MVEIKDLSDNYKENGVTARIKNLLETEINKPFNYDEIMERLNLTKRSNVRVLISQLVKQKKVKRGYLNDVPYFYIEKKE